MEALGAVIESAINNQATDLKTILNTINTTMDEKATALAAAITIGNQNIVAELKAMPEIGNVVKVPTQEVINVFPLVHNYGWTRADMGEIWIPKKGMEPP